MTDPEETKGAQLEQMIDRKTASGIRIEGTTAFIES